MPAPMPSQRLLPALLLLFSAVACHGALAGSYSASMRSNKASTQLIEAASRQYEEGKLDQAAATLERALQIQPNNPATLHYLGVLRLEQGQYEQAEVLAVRSNQRVGSNTALRNRNVQLIQAAQKARGAGRVPVAAQGRQSDRLPAPR
ncbi:tetratricopeptide repeat protein [Pseudomonas sp. TWI628]|uniref:tetratricopeptide repeat protein n=1 Tax=Pseudomonas sp. TWI628 TaxID=3136788 RepID=UPI00320AF265